MLGAAPVGGSPEPSGGFAEPHRGGWVWSTYFAQGLPYSLVHQVSAQFLTAVGASLSVIGLTSLYGLAWNLKFAWSPLVDRFGTTRRWLIGCQLLLALLVAVIGFAAGGLLVRAVAALFVLVSVVAATHDVAIDGYYLEALGTTDQVRLAGRRIVAYRVALWVGQGGLVALAGFTSFRLCFLTAAAILALLGVGHARLLPRVDRPRQVEPSAGLGFVGAVRTFFAKEKAIVSVAFLLVFRAGDALMFAMNAPFLLSLGLDTSRRGIVQGFGGVIFSIIGSLIGLRLIERRGLRSTIVPIALAQSLAILFYVAMAAAKPGLPIVVVGVVAEQLVAGIGTAAFTVFILGRAAGEYKAAHYAFCTALMSVATTLVGAVSGYLATAVGFTVFFGIAFVASLPGVLLARAVPCDREP